MPSQFLGLVSLFSVFIYCIRIVNNLVYEIFLEYSIFLYVLFFLIVLVEYLLLDILQFFLCLCLQCPDVCFTYILSCGG